MFNPDITQYALGHTRHHQGRIAVTVLEVSV